MNSLINGLIGQIMSYWIDFLGLMSQWNSFGDWWFSKIVFSGYLESEINFVYCWFSKIVFAEWWVSENIFLTDLSNNFW